MYLSNEKMIEKENPIVPNVGLPKDKTPSDEDPEQQKGSHHDSEDDGKF